jgi:hypothetical protein
MLIGVSKLVDCVDVHAPFVGKSASANKWLTIARNQIGSFVDESRKLRQMLEGSVLQNAVATLFELQIGNHAKQIRISTPFTDPIDCTLDLVAPSFDGG